MNEMTRRSLFAIAPIAGIAMALPGAIQAAPAVDPPGLTVEWAKLSPATQSMVLVDYWTALTPDEKRNVCLQLRVQGDGQVADLLMPEFTGPGIYDFRVLNEDGSTKFGPTAFLDKSPRRAGFYRWQHYWKGQFQGRAQLLPEVRVRIVRKLEALG